MSLRKKLKMNDSRDDDGFDLSAESDFFKDATETESISNDLSDKFLDIELDLVSKLNTLKFTKPVECVYSPLDYAFVTHSMFVKKYCTNQKKILFLGLNPGPWGMSQTGVPFGEVNVVKDWFKIQGPVQKPVYELSSRRITGLECHRSEISGKRFWALFQKICGTPEIFFEYAYMHNYCPIALMKNSGVNITPAELKSTEAVKLLSFCDESLLKIVNLLQIETVVAIGRFAEKRVKETFKNNNLTNVRIAFLLHPSPRVPGNENWGDKAFKSLQDLDILKYFVK